MNRRPFRFGWSEARLVHYEAAPKAEPLPEAPRPPPLTPEAQDLQAKLAPRITALKVRLEKHQDLKEQFKRQYDPLYKQYHEEHDKTVAILQEIERVVDAFRQQLDRREEPRNSEADSSPSRARRFSTSRGRASDAAQPEPAATEHTRPDGGTYTTWNEYGIPFAKSKGKIYMWKNGKWNYLADAKKDEQANPARGEEASPTPREKKPAPKSDGKDEEVPPGTSKEKSVEKPLDADNILEKYRDSNNALVQGKTEPSLTKLADNAYTLNMPCDDKEVIATCVSMLRNVFATGKTITEGPKGFTVTPVTAEEIQLICKTLVCDLPVDQLREFNTKEYHRVITHSIPKNATTFSLDLLRNDETLGPDELEAILRKDGFAPRRHGTELIVDGLTRATVSSLLATLDTIRFDMPLKEKDAFNASANRLVKIDSFFGTSKTTFDVDCTLLNPKNLEMARAHLRAARIDFAEETSRGAKTFRIKNQTRATFPDLKDALVITQTEREEAALEPDMAKKAADFNADPLRMAKSVTLRKVEKGGEPRYELEMRGMPGGIWLQDVIRKTNLDIKDHWSYRSGDIVRGLKVADVEAILQNLRYDFPLKKIDDFNAKPNRLINIQSYRMDSLGGRSYLSFIANPVNGMTVDSVQKALPMITKIVDGKLTFNLQKENADLLDKCVRPLQELSKIEWESFNTRKDRLAAVLSVQPDPRGIDSYQVTLGVQQGVDMDSLDFTGVSRNWTGDRAKRTFSINIPKANLKPLLDSLIHDPLPGYPDRPSSLITVNELVPTGKSTFKAVIKPRGTVSDKTITDTLKAKKYRFDSEFDEKGDSKFVVHDLDARTLQKLQADCTPEAPNAAIEAFHKHPRNMGEVWSTETVDDRNVRLTLRRGLSHNPEIPEGTGPLLDTVKRAGGRGRIKDSEYVTVACPRSEVTTLLREMAKEWTEQYAFVAGKQLLERTHDVKKVDGESDTWRYSGFGLPSWTFLYNRSAKQWFVREAEQRNSEGKLLSPTSYELPSDETYANRPSAKDGLQTWFNSVARWPAKKINGYDHGETIEGLCKGLSAINDQRDKDLAAAQKIV